MLSFEEIQALNTAAVLSSIPGDEPSGAIPKAVIELAGAALTFYLDENDTYVVALEFEEVPDELLFDDDNDGIPVARVKFKIGGVEQQLADVPGGPWS